MGNSPYDEIERHIQYSIDSFDSTTSNLDDDLYSANDTPPANQSIPQFKINLLNSQAKFNKYRKLLVHPIYYAAVVLIPWYKWAFFEQTSPLAHDEAKMAEIKATVYRY